MAASPTPDPSQQPQGSAAPPDAGGGASPNAQPAPSSAPANPLQMLLAKWYATAKDMASSDPRLASGASKVSEGIQEMQTALISPQQQPSPAQSAQ